MSSTLLTQKSQFVAPLFSWSYELLFPQLLSFDKYLRCPPGVGGRMPFFYSPSLALDASHEPEDYKRQTMPARIANIL